MSQTQEQGDPNLINSVLVELSVDEEGTVTGLDEDESGNEGAGTNPDKPRYKKLPFSALERKLIEELVWARPIIEDKRVNSNNILLKKRAWEDLSVAYNAQPYVSRRQTVQLKRCWENMKSQRKKELAHMSTYMRSPQFGSAASKVPGDIDSNSIETSEDKSVIKKIPDDNLKEINGNSQKERVIKMQIDEGGNSCPLPLKRRFTKEMENSSIGGRNIPIIESETDVRKKRCSINIQHDQELHELRIQREKILIDREKNLLQFEKQMHELQIEKLKLEIDNLKNVNKN